MTMRGYLHRPWVCWLLISPGAVRAFHVEKREAVWAHFAAAHVTIDAVRFQKRGPFAWENYDVVPVPPPTVSGTSRLLIHAVSLATSIQWVPKVEEFLDGCIRHGRRLNTAEEIDLAMLECSRTT